MKKIIEGENSVYLNKIRIKILTTGVKTVYIVRNSSSLDGLWQECRRCLTSSPCEYTKELNVFEEC
jgi:hypothetical protein